MVPIPKPPQPDMPQPSTLSVLVGFALLVVGIVALLYASQGIAFFGNTLYEAIIGILLALFGIIVGLVLIFRKVSS